MSEIFKCPKCGSEFELVSSYQDESIIVSQTACKCNNEPKLIQGKKVLDYAIEKLNELFKGKK
jgi:hypothetical protein